MIRLEMHGRLGNQLFQYAAARSLQMKTGQRILISFRQVNGANTEGNKGWENSLKYFRVCNYTEYSGKRSLLFYKMPIKSQMVGLIYAISYRPYINDINKLYKYQIKWKDILNKNGLFWIANGYLKFDNYFCKEYFLNGSFESPKYFNDIRETLLDEIRPISEVSQKCKVLYNDILQKNSVCVSIRHFELNNESKRLYDVCTPEYYKKAVEFLEGKLDNPVFVLFSDDIHWAKKVFGNDINKHNFIFESEGFEVWEKLQLMSSCKHFVISNSTFSWWAQYLATYKEKIIISPDKWFNNEFRSPLIEKGWIKINGDGRIVNS